MCLACGLSSIAAADVIHLDLKPENVVMMLDGSIKIIDFGNSGREASIYSELDKWVYQNVSGPQEVLEVGKSDLYAAAMLVAHLLFFPSETLKKGTQ